MAGSTGCQPDSSGENWFACHYGTVGCPRTHEGLTPHCITCESGACEWGHDPPVREMTHEGFRKYMDLLA